MLDKTGNRGVAVEDEVGVVRLDATCGGGHVGRVFKGPKCRAGTRWVPLTRPAQAALRRNRKTQDVDRRRRPFRDHHLVFCTPNGDRCARAWSAQFAEHVTACGLPPIRLHDMRHGACSMLLAGGVPIEVVQMISARDRHYDPTRVYPQVMRGTTEEQVEQATQPSSDTDPR